MKGQCKAAHDSSGAWRYRKLQRKIINDTGTRVRDRRLTSFVICNDGDKLNERSTITVVDEVRKLVFPMKYVPDALFSLL